MSRREIYACDCCENEIIIKICQNKKDRFQDKIEED